MTPVLNPREAVLRAAGEAVAHWHATTQGVAAARFDYVMARRGVRHVCFAPETQQPVGMTAAAARKALLHFGATQWSTELAVRIRGVLPFLAWEDIWNDPPFGREQVEIETIARSFPVFWPKPKPYLDRSFDLAVRLFQAPGVWRGTRAVARALEHAGIASFASVDRIMRGAVPNGRASAASEAYRGIVLAAARGATASRRVVCGLLVIIHPNSEAFSRESLLQHFHGRFDGRLRRPYEWETIPPEVIDPVSDSTDDRCFSHF